MADVRITTPNEYNYVLNTSTNSPIAATGFASLVQIVIKTLLTTPGRDVFEPGYGGGLTSILNVNSGRGKTGTIQADVGLSVIKTMQDIIDGQNKSIDSLTPDARLRSLRLDSLEYDSSDGLWLVDILIESEAGTIAPVGLEV